LIELISGSFGGLNGYRSEVRGLGVEEATHVAAQERLARLDPLTTSTLSAAEIQVNLRRDKARRYLCRRDDGGCVVDEVLGRRVIPRVGHLSGGS
jgi:hypothetical protein